MTTILDGTKLASKINEQTKEEISTLNTNPHLVGIQVGENAESELYLQHKSAKAKEVGIIFTHLTFKKEIETMELVEKIQEMNQNPQVDGIMVQLPLPAHIDTEIVAQSIAPWKDVDGFHPLNKGLLDINRSELIPPTAQGVIELLNEYNIPMRSKIVTVVGLGEIAGKPVSKLFMNNGATVIMCNKDTKDVSAMTKQADIVVAAVGYKHLINDMGIKEGAVVINIGVTKDEDGIHGDVELTSMLEKASYVTPITGGTGPMTVALLMRNTLTCHKLK